MSNNGDVLEKAFGISMTKHKITSNDVKNKLFMRSPWETDYLTELYVSSEDLKEQIEELFEKIARGGKICSIVGEDGSGKSYFLNILWQGLKTQHYNAWLTIPKILFFDSDDIDDDSRPQGGGIDMGADEL